MPAAFWWDPTTLTTINGQDVYSSSTPDNWRVSATDPLVRWTRAPGTTDDLHFRGDVSSADCYIPDQTPTAPTNAFAGLHLLFGPSPTTPPPTVPPPGEPPAPGTSVLTAYIGTVTVADSLAVGTLEVDCGQVKQADPSGLQPPVPYAITAGTLTVSSSLDWTGGTLNSNSVAGTIALAPGATGIAEPSFTNPGINQTVSLGSTIELLGPPSDPNADPETPPSGTGSSLDVLSGDYMISNRTGFVVSALCNLNLLPLPDDVPPPTSPQPPGGGSPELPQYKASVELKAVADETGTTTGNGQDAKTGTVSLNKYGTLKITPANRPSTSTALATVNTPKGYIFNSGGKVISEDRVKATFGGSTFSGYFLQPGATEVNASVIQQDGLLSVQTGSQLLTTAGVVIHGGQLQCPGLAADTSRTATIEATDAGATTYALVLGSNATVSFPSPATWNLELKGKFRWLGTVQAILSPLDTTLCDKIKVSKEVEIKSPAKLKVIWSVANHDTTMANLAQNSYWDVVISDLNDGVTGLDASTPELIRPNGTAVQMKVGTDLNNKTVKAVKS